MGGERHDGRLPGVDGREPRRAQVSAVLLYFGYLLIAVGIFGIVHLLRHRSVVLSHVGGVLAVWGWITLPGLLVSDFYDLSLAQWSNQQDAVAISERAGSYVGSAILGIPVMLGLLGLVLLLVALWRAGFAPAWVPTVFLLGSVASSFGPSSLLTFTLGTASWLATLGYVGLKILKISADEWEHGVPPVTGPAGARPRVQ